MIEKQILDQNLQIHPYYVVKVNNCPYHDVDRVNQIRDWCNDNNINEVTWYEFNHFETQVLVYTKTYELACEATLRFT